MTTFTEAMRDALGSGAFGSRVNAVDVVVTMVLVGLLIEREVLRAHAAQPKERRLPRTGIVIAPLVFVFSIFIGARMFSLLT